MILSTQNKRGQLLFLFFSTSFSVIGFANEDYSLQYQSVIFEAERSSKSNYGLITNDFWNKQNLTSSPHQVIGELEIFLKLSAQFNYFEFYVGRENIHTFVGSANALTIAANDSKYATPGIFPINGSYKFFDYNTVGISKTKFLDSKIVDLTIAPEFITLHNFQAAQGNAVLNYSYNNSSLIGNLDRQGINSYGFLQNVNNTELGYGYSVNSSLNIHQPQFDVSVKAKNAISGIFVTNYFFSNMIINANEESNKFVYSSVPTITGNYGQTSRQMKLPLISEVVISSKINPALGMGFRGIDSNYYTFIKSEYSYLDYQTNVEINSLNNLTMFFIIKNFGTPNLNVSIAAAVAAGESKPNVYFTKITYAY